MMKVLNGLGPPGVQTVTLESTATAGPPSQDPEATRDEGATSKGGRNGGVLDPVHVDLRFIASEAGEDMYQAWVRGDVPDGHVCERYGSRVLELFSLQKLGEMAESGDTTNKDGFDKIFSEEGICEGSPSRTLHGHGQDTAKLNMEQEGDSTVNGNA